MKDVAKLLNALEREGVIQSYAVFGAVAQMRYTEAVSTMDADILVSIDTSNPLSMLGPIYEACRERGYYPEGESIRVGEWPVQFIPVYDEITSDALKHAETTDMEGEPLHVVTADFLAVIALKTGRTKDALRIISLMDSGSVTASRVQELATTYGLDAKWQSFTRRYIP
jgi:hypothetical protein